MHGAVDRLQVERAHGIDHPARLVAGRDDGPLLVAHWTIGRARIGATHLGGMNALGDLRGAAFVVGVGSPGARATLAERVEESGLHPVTLVHPTATVGSDVELGPGTVICAGARVSTHVTIGRHVHINPNVTVGHETVIEDYASVNPLASISGNVTLHRGVLVGTTACVNQGLTVGGGSVVGSGATVVRDVGPGRTVVGVPARPLEEPRRGRTRS